MTETLQQLFHMDNRNLVVSSLSCFNKCAMQSSSYWSSSASLSSPLLEHRARKYTIETSEVTNCFPTFPCRKSQEIFPSQKISSSAKNTKIPSEPQTTHAKEKMMMMKCQRMREDKSCEEVEIMVPVKIYKKMVRVEGPQPRKAWHCRMKNIFI